MTIINLLLACLVSYWLFICIDRAIDIWTQEENIEEVKEKEQTEKQAEKQTNDWVRDLRRRRIISKGPELNRIARSVFGDIGMFDVNEIDGKLSFRTDLGHFSINDALSRDYESILDELEILKKRRENTLANKVSSNTNLDSRSSNSKKYCFRRYAGCRNEAESGWRYRGHCKQCYQDYVESTDEDG